MTKRLFILFLFIGVLATQIAIAEPLDTGDNFKLIVDEATVSLAAPVRLINGVFMLPMRAFFENLGATVTWYPETRQVIAYKYNMQVKLAIDDAVALRNGNRYQLKQAPLIIDDLTYIPAKFTAESFDMSYQIADDRINLRRRENARKYFVDGVEYETRDIKRYDMTFAVPYGWQELSDLRFGIDDEYDDYAMSITAVPADARNSQAFIDELKQSLIDKHEDKITFTYQSIHNSDDLTFQTLGYFYNGLSGNRIVDIYLLKQGDHFFVFEGNSAAKSDIGFVRSVFREMLDKLQFNRQTIETSDEHYYEYPAMYAVGMNLNKPIASNMEVVNYVPFEGSLKQIDKYDYLYAIVKKGAEEKTFKIGIDDAGNFNAKIFTPFGLAKHNIAIMGNQKNSEDDVLLKFSALNLSNAQIKYLIPSEYVRSNETEALSLANYLTYQNNNAYLKAKAIFDFVTDEIELENLTLSALEQMRNSTQVVTEKTATPLEMCLLTTALFRASDIPAKLTMGKIGRRIFYAVEAKINGVWVVYDPVSVKLSEVADDSAKVSPQDRATPCNYFYNHYYLDLAEFKALFDSYRQLSY